jgi:hypothetical protein
VLMGGEAWVSVLAFGSVVAWLGGTARWWCRHTISHRLLGGLFIFVVLAAPFAALVDSARESARLPERSDELAATLALGKAVDVFPAAFCAEPSPQKRRHVTLPGDLREALREAQVRPHARWRDVYLVELRHPLKCPVTPRSVPDAAASPSAGNSSPTTASPRSSPNSSESLTPSSSPTPQESPGKASSPDSLPAPGTAVSALSAAVSAWMTSREAPTEERVRTAFVRLDDDVVKNTPGWTSAGWPIWLALLGLTLLAARTIWVFHRLYGEAPLVVAAVDKDVDATAAAARDAFLGAVQEIRLIRPSATPTPSSEGALASLEAAAAVVPAGGAVVKALAGLLAHIRAEVRYDAALVGIDVSGQPGLAVGVSERPGGSRVLDRSVVAAPAGELGRSVAFDAGCAVLDRSRNVPVWARWPVGTGEALDRYVQALRESRPPAASTADDPSDADDLGTRLKHLRRAALVAPGNGLIRHELGLLEFQTGRFVHAANLFAQNAHDYPRFYESRYRLAVTLSMSSNDVRQHWFRAPVVRRGSLVELLPVTTEVPPGVLAERGTMADVRQTTDWLLRVASGELRRLSRSIIRGPDRNLRRASSAAGDGSDAVRIALRKSESVTGSGPPAALVRYLTDGEYPTKLLTAEPDRVWQVSYNQSCGLARLYGIAAANNCPQDLLDSYARAAVRMVRGAVRSPMFVMARWREDVGDLLGRVDPDFEPLRDHPAFQELLVSLGISEPAQ